MLPTYFLAHGSPTNALEENYFTQDWLNLTTELNNHPIPEAIVIFSAHWHTPNTLITANHHPPTIHDFGGFSNALYNCQYPCPGNPELAKAIKTLLNTNHINCELSEAWGLDHGSWVLLKHLYPEANVPVLQISLDNSHNDLHQHYNIAQQLKPLREQGILFIGSGNIVHNISKWMSMRQDSPINWAVEFDKSIHDAISNNLFEHISDYQQLPFASEAVPTVEHFLPLIYCLGLHGDQHHQWDTKGITHSDFGFNNLSTACSRSIAFAGSLLSP